MPKLSQLSSLVVARSTANLVRFFFGTRPGPNMLRSVAIVGLALAFMANPLAGGDAPGGTAGGGEATIHLISARDHIEGSMLGPRSVYADRDRIYLASYQGKLFVIARDRAADFPLLQVVQDTTQRLTAVRGDAKNIYVTSGDGYLRVYRKGDPLVLVDVVKLGIYGLSDLVVTNRDLYVGTGQAHLAIDQNHVYVTALNEGELGLQVDKRTLTAGLTFGQQFEPDMTIVFDRKSGERISAIPNPKNVFGGPGFPSIYADGRILAETIAGCCGSGIYLYDPKTLSPAGTVAGRLSTNTVVRSGRWLVGGSEGGQVDLYDLRQNPSPLVSTVDLRQITGHTGLEDIEIRALWADGFDNLIFAGSSWGNDQSRGPSLPSFFVLEMAR